MLSKRVIPCLTLKNGSLVKTVRFKNPNYIGDPINAVKIFNEKEVDEIIILDISATKEGREPNFELIQDITEEAFMPLAYGGGIKTLDHIKKLFLIGVEKVVLNSTSFLDGKVVKQAVELFGSQSIVGSMDIKKSFLGKQYVYTHSGKKNTKKTPLEYLNYLENLGVGEVFVNFIDLDGMMSGYNIETSKLLGEKASVPLVICGGAGSLSDIQKLVYEANINSISAGSIFIYHGKHNGVLINYPSRKFIEEL